MCAPAGCGGSGSKRITPSESEVWLVFYKQHTGEKSIELGDAIDEALCFGWIDSLVRRLDDDRYARKFTPRKLDSRWSTINRRRYAELKAEGRLAQPGLDRPPTARSGDAPRPSITALPSYMDKELQANPRRGSILKSSLPRASGITSPGSIRPSGTRRNKSVCAR